MAFAHGNWPSGPYNHQPYDMRRNMFYHNNPDWAPQNYHYQHLNGNQLVSYQSTCNCIKLRYCSPVIDMAQKMYSEYIADYLTSQHHVIACNYIDGEMAVCCPLHSELDNMDSREKRGHESARHHGEEKKWIWNTEEITSSEEARYLKPPTYPSNQHTTYPIQGFYPFSKSAAKKSNRSPFIASHEDPNSSKNCPPAFSAEFVLHKNHTFYKEPENATTPVPRISEVTTPAPPFEIVDMATKMSLINDESCGRTVGSRIMGGEDAGVGKFSWMGRLAYRNKCL